MVERLEVNDQQPQIIAEGPKTPQVLRDKRGRVLWKLPGNTSEQNEQLGIKNIQILFLEKFPEFVERFPRDNDGRIMENKREDAKGFILENVNSRKKFRRIFKSTFLNSKSLPYFGTSYRLILKKIFSVWGIHFKDSDFPGLTNRKLNKARTGSEILTDQQIEEELMSIYKKEGQVTKSILDRLGRGKLVLAVRRRYGSMIQFKNKLGIPLNKRERESVNKRPGGYWDPEKVLEELKEFYIKEGDLTYQLLVSKQRFDLIAQIRKFFKGGIPVVRVKLGILDQNHSSSLSPDQANEQLERLLGKRQ